MKLLFTLSVLLLAADAAQAQPQTNSAPFLPVRRLEVRTGPVSSTPARTNVLALVSDPATNSATAEEPASPGPRLVHARPDPSFLEGSPKMVLMTPKANEMTLGKRTVSGIAVQLMKARNPLQLLNPGAAARYGSGWDNLDERSGGVTGPGVKVFAVNF